MFCEKWINKKTNRPQTSKAPSKKFKQSRAASGKLNNNRVASAKQTMDFKDTYLKSSKSPILLMETKKQFSDTMHHLPFQRKYSAQSTIK